MEPTSEKKYLLCEGQDQLNKEHGRQVRREWMRNFALVFSLAALTVAVSTLLAR
jgi:hypothetical protein